MSTIVSRNVSDLLEPERHALEQILGRPLKARERVHVIVELFSPRRIPREGR